MKVLKLQRSIMRSDLKPIPKLTLLALTNLLDWHTWQGQTSYEILAAESGLSLASVKRGITDITKRGFIYKKRTGDHNGYRRNYYTINQDQLFTYIANWNPKPKDEDKSIVSNRHLEIAQVDTINGSNRHLEIAQVDTINGSNRHHATALLDTTNQPNTQPYLEANKIQPNNSVAYDAQGASLEDEEGEYLKWEDIPIDLPMPKTRWEDHGVHVPTQEEMMRKYK